MLKLHYIGKYDSMPDVWAANPYGGIEGDYVHVGTAEYYWNKYTRKWVDSAGADAPSQGGQTEAVDPITHVYRSTSLGSTFDDTNIHETFNAYAINLIRNLAIQNGLDIDYVESLFTNGKAKNALLLDGYTVEEIMSGSAEVLARLNVEIQNRISGDARIEGKLDEMFTDVNHTLIKTTHSFESLNDIEAKGYVIGHNGVAALGIVDTEDGEERYRVKVYDAITENEAEVVTDIPTAYSVGKLKKDIDTEGFSTFSTSVSYNRGDIVNYNGHAYRFKSSKGAGDWNSARVEMLNYDSLTKPLGMSESTINTIFDNVISGL